MRGRPLTSIHTWCVGGSRCFVRQTHPTTRSATVAYRDIVGILNQLQTHTPSETETLTCDDGKKQIECTSPHTRPAHMYSQLQLQLQLINRRGSNAKTHHDPYERTHGYRLNQVACYASTSQVPTRQGYPSLESLSISLSVSLKSRTTNNVKSRANIRERRGSWLGQTALSSTTLTGI